MKEPNQKLYLIARNAKKDGKLSSASSYGGKIRARKTEDDIPTLITNEQQLLALIDSDVSDMSSSTIQQSTNTSSSFSTVIESPSASNRGSTSKTNTQKTKASTRSSERTSSTGTSRSNKNGNIEKHSRSKHVRKYNNNDKQGKRLLDTSGNNDPAQKKKPKVVQRK